MTTTYTKMTNGAWGVRVQFSGKGMVQSGDKVEVKKKSGERKMEVIDRVLSEYGSTYICSIRRAESTVQATVIGQDEMRQLAARRSSRYDDGAPTIHRNPRTGMQWVEY